ncbi:MAG: HD domain-containing phosphohydrolase [Nitrospirota bacterium]
MDTIKKFISTFMSAISTCSLYSKEHASVDDLTEKVLSILNELLRESDSLEVIIIQDDLVVNKRPIREPGLQGINLIKRLKKKGISRVDFLTGITFSEIKQFIANFSEMDSEVKTYPHIKTGVIDVSLLRHQIDANLPADGFISEQVKMVKEAYQDISPFKKLNAAGLEEIVVNFIVAFKKEASILKLLSPVKSHDEYTYTHATNVAVLTMFQAESLGIKDELLRDIGVAGLLHDVGKLFISKDILGKKGVLNEKDWEEIRRHPLYGARHLAGIKGLTPLAPIVAFEHHLRYDGQGYPKFKVAEKKQHFVSQIVSISDFFDALRRQKPYRKELEIKEILYIMKSDAGSSFNPFLVDNFIRTIQTAFSA